MIRIITKTSFLPSMTVWGGCTVIAVSFTTKSMHQTSITLSLPEWITEFYKVALTFKSVDEILWGDHSNETCLSVLSHGATFFSEFYKMKFEIFFVEFCLWPHLVVKRPFSYTKVTKINHQQQHQTKTKWHM